MKDKKGILLIDRRFDLHNAPILLLVIHFVLFAVSAFQSLYLRLEPNQVVSGPAYDRPDIRSEAYDEARNVGWHYFGDYLQPYDWARLDNPWTHSEVFLANYPPFPIRIMDLFLPLPYYLGLGIYLSLMVLSSGLIVWTLLNKATFMQRFVASISVGVATAPILMAFDRGNNVGFFSLLTGLLIIALTKDNKKLAIFAVTIMILVKIYPVFLLITFISKRWFKEAAATLILSGTVTLLLFAAAPGEMSETLSGFLEGTGGANAYWDGTVSLGTSIVLQQVGVLSPNQLNTVVALAPLAWDALRYSIIVVLVSVAFLLRERISDIHSVLLGGFAMTLFYGNPVNYGWTWIVPVLAFLIGNSWTGRQDVSLRELWTSSSSLTLALLGSILLVVPHTLAVPGTNKSIASFLGYFLAVCFVCALASEHWASKRQVAPSASRQKRIRTKSQRGGLNHFSK